MDIIKIAAVFVIALNVYFLFRMVKELIRRRKEDKENKDIPTHQELG